MTTPAAVAPARLRVVEKISYGAGAFGASIANTMLLLYFNFYLTDTLKLAPLLAGVVQLVRNSWVAINDPIIGMLTDRTRSKFGRRRSWMLFAFVPFGLLFALLWQKPMVTSQWGMVAWIIALVFLFDVATTAIWVPYNALTPEMTQDYDERTSLNGFRMVFAMLAGLLVGGAVDPILAAFSSPARGYSAVGWATGALAALPFILVVAVVRERYQPPAGVKTDHGLVKMFRQTLRNKAFLVALLVYVLAWVCVGMASAMFVPFLTHWMHMQGHIWKVLLAVQLSAVIAIPGIVWMSGKLGKKGAYIVGISFWALVQTAMFFLSPEHAPYAIVLGALAGIGLGTAHVIPWSMIPDCVEIDELETGERREGAYYGVMACVEKIGVAAALTSLDLVLEHFGYVGGAPEQSERARWAVRALMGPGPALLLLLSIGVVMFYPITKARHAEIRRALEARRRG